MLLMFAEPYCSIDVAFRSLPAGDGRKRVKRWLDCEWDVHQPVPDGENR